MSPAARILHEQRRETYAALERGMREAREPRGANPLILAPLMIAVALLIGYLWG